MNSVTFSISELINSQRADCDSVNVAQTSLAWLRTHGAATESEYPYLGDGLVLQVVLGAKRVELGTVGAGGGAVGAGGDAVGAGGGAVGADG